MLGPAEITDADKSGASCAEPRKFLTRSQRRTLAAKRWRVRCGELEAEVVALEDFATDLLAILDAITPTLSASQQKAIHDSIDARRYELDFPEPNKD